MYFSEAQVVEVSFGHLCVQYMNWWNLQGFSINWKVILVKREFCFALIFTYAIQVKATILVIWKIGVFRRKRFVQKLEIFIANKIGFVVKDEEKAELFKRSHATTKKVFIYKAQQITRRNRKGRLSSELTTSIMALKRQPLTQSTWVVTSPSPRKQES